MATKLILLGAGKIGDAILNLLSHTGDYDITVADRDPERLKYVEQAGFPRTRIVQADLGDQEIVTELIRGHQVTLSACPYFLTPIIAGAARAANSHYFDLTEDVESTRIVKQLAEGADCAFVPQCGLAPGFISIVANDVALGFDSLRDVSMRVGALPTFPNNALKYNLTWSTDGLINEYCNPCEAIVDGQLRETAALEEIEHFSLDGIDYEAFNTSGGLGTLCASLQGKVQNLNYKTVRYPGHRDIVKMLIRDLELGKLERRPILKDVLETSIPMTKQDVVLVFVSVVGMRQGRLEQESYAKKIYAQEVNAQLLSAIQLTTAAGICTMVDLVLSGKLPQHGLVRQEQAKLSDFLSNRFGRYYAI
ncbi:MULTISPECIES: saccharopine dehydrogenase family protein [unclassified Undibacterium]|uniref:saccharopine dehydrogenase family protein n=1 Tax=unclassified Undibacterium TaxID=2630295 RepID=UPI002AC97359|nr:MULTISPECIES: saccharopine dehydrogenase C-terminal domain-containing protein [unclassified Undibacterium]MEB0138286.1 saccharopine dehydrogenase C-terminal domain-containing protein [Undibacterium sp. CCC2.1]MEB0170772.1 saccharopine dehydrogenase C-terminal domain-containing protein [Undibacterium sp. CCC1.1]MEB0174661.1 saccharopine dehydrogenase C-terminal domain-containing protein [Undibacterium sp. CCC3.4]MEB0213858.1 saccharopine dehydrogenase C-terminal domain-containing protein [Und